MVFFTTDIVELDLLGTMPEAFTKRLMFCACGKELDGIASSSTRIAKL